LQQEARLSTITCRKGILRSTATFLGGKRFVVNLFWSIRSSLQDFKRKATTSECSKLLSVAFPSRIGCGVAGGDWNGMRKDIIDFATENPT